MLQILSWLVFLFGVINLINLHKIPVDLILFADTGGEQPHTYEFIRVFNAWLDKHGLPKITPVFYTDKDGNRLTLEEECFRSHTLPSIAYGFKKCSLKHKIGTQEKFCNHYIRSRFLAMPAKLSPTLAAMDGNQAAIFDEMKKAIDETLEELSDYRVAFAVEDTADERTEEK